MRHFILLFTAALFVGCASPGVQVTTDDEKSQAINFLELLSLTSGSYDAP